MSGLYIKTMYLDYSKIYLKQLMTFWCATPPVTISFLIILSGSFLKQMPIIKMHNWLTLAVLLQRLSVIIGMT